MVKKYKLITDLNNKKVIDFHNALARLIFEAVKNNIAIDIIQGQLTTISQTIGYQQMANMERILKQSLEQQESMRGYG